MMASIAFYSDIILNQQRYRMQLTIWRGRIELYLWSTTVQIAYWGLAPVVMSVVDSKIQGWSVYGWTGRQNDDYS